MQQSLDFISGMQSDESSSKPDTRVNNPVLTFNCEGDIRTKKDPHVQSIQTGFPDQQNLNTQLYSEPNVNKSQSANSTGFHPNYPPLDSQGHILGNKNHSQNSGNNLNYHSSYQHPSHDSVIPGNSASSKQSVNAQQYANVASHRPQGVQMNNVHTVNSPNHMGMHNSEYSGVVSGHNDHLNNLGGVHPLGSVNDTSKVNYAGANQSATVPIVKLENMKKNQAMTNDMNPILDTKVRMSLNSRHTTLFYLYL